MESVKPGVLQGPEVIRTAESGKQPVAEGTLTLPRPYSFGH